MLTPSREEALPVALAVDCPTSYQSTPISSSLPIIPQDDSRGFALPTIAE